MVWKRINLDGIIEQVTTDLGSWTLYRFERGEWAYKHHGRAYNNRVKVGAAMYMAPKIEDDMYSTSTIQKIEIANPDLVLFQTKYSFYKLVREDDSKTDV